MVRFSVSWDKRLEVIFTSLRLRSDGRVKWPKSNFCPYLTHIWFFTTVRTAQIRFFVSGPRSNKYPMFCNATSATGPVACCPLGKYWASQHERNPKFRWFWSALLTLQMWLCFINNSSASQMWNKSQLQWNKNPSFHYLWKTTGGTG